VTALEGRVVLVTRPRAQARELADLLERRGAVSILAPAVDIRPVRSAALTRAVAGLAGGEFEWLTLTSAATVDVLADWMDPVEVRAHVAVVGEGTAARFTRWAGRAADLMPRIFETEALAAAFPAGTGAVLCLRADIAPPGLERTLAAKGWSPTRVDAYRTVLARRLPAAARAQLAKGDVDAITFTSASTVGGFASALAGPPPTTVVGSPKVVCIGPVTARAARDHGFDVHAIADPHTLEGLVHAVERVFERGPDR
jgi:uroporphyrinogen-III synthase